MYVWCTCNIAFAKFIWHPVSRLWGFVSFASKFNLPESPSFNLEEAEFSCLSSLLILKSSMAEVASCCSCRRLSPAADARLAPEVTLALLDGPPVAPPPPFALVLLTLLARSPVTKLVEQSVGMNCVTWTEDRKMESIGCIRKERRWWRIHRVMADNVIM